ncbi:dynein heavy chain domain-containing protein 1 isoform X10 [Tamandua tetradactyla]|uniref:dynein heavy chain domain-containing protein 1 isoform X10 n=1 Tax=Tamandua tetradactyla TaxID=48850 RepID=UPI00405451C3
MIPHQQFRFSSLPLPPIPLPSGEAQKPGAWNWQSEPEEWARSIRQQLNVQLLLVPEEKRVGPSPEEGSPDPLKSSHSIWVPEEEGQPWNCERKQKQFLKAVIEAEQPTVLELLLTELQTLFSGVLQDGSPAAWHYLHAVLGLLPPYRGLLCGRLDLLPFLEQLYRWAPWVQSQLQLDLLDAIEHAFPPDTSLLESSSHADCCPQKQRFHHGPPGPACPFVQARWGGQKAEEELATWLRPLTLPELQHCLGIVGAEMAQEETQWLDGLSLLPLALATDIPVQYESSGTDNAEEEPTGRETRSQLNYEVPEEKASQKRSTDFLPKTSFLGSQVMRILRTERYLKKIHFLYLNVAPSRYFRPYSLMIVPPNKVNPEHYIFSPFGILHVHPVEGSETIMLGSWHRHSVLWQQLQFIPFFKYYLLRKAFTCWKKSVKLQGLHRHRTFLGNHLLLAVPHFGAGLLHISRLLQELHSVSWLPQERDRCYELLELQRALAKENHKALRLLLRCLCLCSAILQVVHEDTYHMQQGLQERVKCCKRIRTSQGSIYLKRVQYQELEQRLKQTETWLLQLGHLARLVDYMICQNLVSIVEEEITSFVANILQAPRHNPFLLTQLVFDNCGQLSHMPSTEKMIKVLTGGIQSVKASVLKLMQSADRKTSWDTLISQEEDEEEDSDTEFLMPKFLGQPSDAVRIFCGQDIGLVWPWKFFPNTGTLEVRGYRLRGQYSLPNYTHLQKDLDDNPRIQEALTKLQTVLEAMLQEVQEFCREHHWMIGIYEFLQAWGPGKLEAMRGCPIKDYVILVGRLNVWQSLVSNMPDNLLTKGKLLLLSCQEIQAEMESRLGNIRKDILAHVQNECWSCTQQLMTELTDFIDVFQNINSDIHTIAQCSQKLNEANEQYMKLEERMEYIRSLHELIRNHFSLFSTENEALDISLLDVWEAFQFERSQASEFLLSKRHAIVPKLQQLMAAASVELKGLLEKALSGPFLDPAQEQRSTENQLISLEHQFQNTASHLSELHHAYATFTGDESPVPLPACGARPIVQQQRIWHLYRIVSENISEWKCMAFAKFSLAMAQEKTDGWLTEAARMSATLGLHSPVLQHCMHMLEEFRNYLPLLTKMGTLQLQNPNCQALLRALGLSSINNMDVLTLGHLLTCPLLEFSDRINQIWQCENEQVHAQETLRRLQCFWESRQLRLLNFILHVPYEPTASERSKRQILHSPQLEVVGKDSGTFILAAPVLAPADCQLSSPGAHFFPDYSSLQNSIQDSLQRLFKILAIQKSGDLYKIALEWVTIMHGLGSLLEVWVTFQQKWIFLNKVLHEMKIQFPSSDLSSRFKALDDQYRTLMRISVADPLVLSLVMPSAKRSPYFQGQQLQQLLQAGSMELEENFSSTDPVTQSFKSSKSSSLNNPSQADNDDVENKRREHLLAVSSFLFALIWGFGAHLPSRVWPLFDTFLRSSLGCLSNYPELPPSALVFDLHVCPEDGTLVPFTGQYLNSRIKGTLGTFTPSPQTERLLYVVDLLLSQGQPVLLAGEAAAGKSAFVEVLVEPNHPYMSSPIHPAFSSTHLRLLLSQAVQGQTQASPCPGPHQDSKGFLLFLLEDLHLAASDPEKSCQPVLETLRQAIDGTVYTHTTLELQTLQPTINFLATVTVPGCCEHPLCPRLFRRFTVLALGSMTQATLLSRHTPGIQAWLEHFPSVEREGTLAKALVQASVDAWEAVRSCFMPSPVHPHYRFSLHSVSHLLGSLQLLPTRVGSRGFVTCPNHQEHLHRVSGLRGTRLTIMMAMRNMVRLWLHEAQRTFCDRLDSPRERSHCSKLLLEVAQSIFCWGSDPQGKEHMEDKEEEKVPEVESEGELAQWEDLSNSGSETEEEEDPYGLQVPTGSHYSNSSLAPVSYLTRSISREVMESISLEEGMMTNCNLQQKRSQDWWQKTSRMDIVTPLLLPVLLLRPQEKPSDLIFSQELKLGSNSEGPNLYLERQWERLEEQLATSAAQLRLRPHFALCRSMAQHVTRLVRVLARPRQHGLLLSGALGTGRRTAITMATSICQTRLFHLPSGSEEAIFQCLQDASWHAGMLGQSVALLVPEDVNLTTLHRLLALVTSGSFPDQYTEADLDSIEKQFPRDNLSVKQNIRKEMVLQRFYQQVCSHLHLFILVRDDQARNQLSSTLFLRLLQLAIASIDRYEPWDEAALVSAAQHHLGSIQSLPLNDGSLKYPDLQASIPNVAKAMAFIHLSATSYNEHLCPQLPLITPKTFLDLLDTFLLMQQQIILQTRSKAQRIQNALENLKMLIEQHTAHTKLVFNLQQELKVSSKSLSTFRQQLEEDKLLYKQQLAECQQQENLIENLAKQRDALQAQQDAFLQQMGQAFLGPLSQLQVADVEELRSYRSPPESVVRVTDALCDLFHCEPGWSNAKQLLCTEDFYQELVFFPKEKMTDSELIKLNTSLRSPGMSDKALRAISVPAANLTAWLWAVLRYGLARRRGLPTGLLLQQVEATLAREQVRLGCYQFQVQEILEHSLVLNKKMEDAQASHIRIVENLNRMQHDQYYKWPIKAALLTPMQSWTKELQKLKGHCMSVFGDALLCSAAIVYLGPFPPLRRQELLDKWLALCRGFQEDLGPDDIAQALMQKHKSVSVPQKPLLPTRSPFSLLSLLSSDSEQHQWDRDMKPQAKSARLAGLLLRSRTHYHSCRWPLLLDPSYQALTWLNPLPLEENWPLVSAPSEVRGNGLMRKQDVEGNEEDREEDYDENEKNDEVEDKIREQKEKENKKEKKKEELKQEENEQAEKENKRENEYKLASQTQPLPLPYLHVLSGADPELGPKLREAAASGANYVEKSSGNLPISQWGAGLPVLLTNMDLGLGCQELQQLLQREQLSPPQVQPGFCLYLSTTLPLRALRKVLDCNLLKGLNVLDLGLNVEVLEEQMLHEIMCIESPELKTCWQDLKTRYLDTCEAMEAAEEQLLAMLLVQNLEHQKPVKFLRIILRAQTKLCQMRAQYEELEDLRQHEVVFWAPYRRVVQHGIALVQALSSLQNMVPLFHMSPEKWLAATKKALDNINQREIQQGEDLASRLLQLRAQLTHQFLGSTVAALGLTQVPLVGALGALALLRVAGKASELERLAFWPGLVASPSTGHSKPVLGLARPAWLGLRAWHECGMLELLPPFAGLRASLAGHSNVWQAYLSLSSTVLGPAPGPGPDPLSLLQKLILWRVLRPDRLAGALVDFTTSLLGRPLDETLGTPTMPLEYSQPTQPMLVLLPLPGHPTATLHPLTVIQKLAAKHEQGQKHLQVIALGSEAWDPIPVVVHTLCQAMHKGYWLVLDNCHLMPHWPKELLQPLLDLCDGAKVVSDLELELLSAQRASRNVATVHRDFRLWLIVSAEAIASLPAVLTYHSMPVFWDQSLELSRILIDSLGVVPQGLCNLTSTQALPLLLLHGLLLHRQLYGLRLQAHRGRWSQVTLIQVLQTQDQLLASLSNPSAAMQELAASVFYGGPLGDTEDRETLKSLTQACLSPSSGGWTHPHTPQYLLATLMPSPELGELDAMAECKAQMHLLPTPPEPRVCGLSEGPQAWLLRRQSRALLSALQRSSPAWVPVVRPGARRAELRLRQRLVQAARRLESLQTLLTQSTRQREFGAKWPVLGPDARGPLEGFLETETLELSELVSTLQRDLNCLLQQLKGAPPCASRRCVAVAQALWIGRLPPPWRPHTPTGSQPPWHWLRQLSRRGQLLVRYLAAGTGTVISERVFHLSAFRRPRCLLLALRWEAVLAMAARDQDPPSRNLPGSQSLGFSHAPHKRQELNSNPLHLWVENGPNPRVPEMGLLLIGLQLLHAEWDPIAGALQDSTSSQPSPLPPVSVSTQARVTKDLPPAAGLAVYSCPVYMEGPLGITKLHSRNILAHLPLPTKLSPATCAQRRVHVCSPPLL